MINLDDASYEWRQRCRALKKLVEKRNKKSLPIERYSQIYQRLYDELIKQTFNFEYEILNTAFLKLNLGSNYRTSIYSVIFDTSLEKTKKSIWSSDRDNFNYERDLNWIDKTRKKITSLEENEIEGLVWYWGPNTNLEDLEKIVSKKVYCVLNENKKEILKYLNNPDNLNDFNDDV